MLIGNQGDETIGAEELGQLIGTIGYEIVSRIEDTDLPTALTRLASDQASLEATDLVTGRLTSLSLADYLR